MSTASFGSSDGEKSRTQDAPPEINIPGNELPNIYFRNVIPTDLPAIYELEKSSYPTDEAASRSQLQYRQHHAAIFFRCAVLLNSDETNNTQDSSSAYPDLQTSASTGVVGGSSGGGGASVTTDLKGNRHNSLNGSGTIIGFVTATRCHTFNEQSMSVHSPTGPLLAIHSVVVAESYRKHGVGSALLNDYMQKYLPNLELNYGIDKVVLIAKAAKLSFYVNAGFRVMKMSEIEHGSKDRWYDCECDLNLKGIGEKKNRKGWLMMERKFPCWIVDSFSTSGGGIGGGIVGSTKPGVPPAGSGPSRSASESSSGSSGAGVGMVGGGSSNPNIGRKGSGNPAAIVMVPRKPPSKPTVVTSRQSSSSSTASAPQALITNAPSHVITTSSNGIANSPVSGGDPKAEKFDASSDGDMSNPDNEATVAWMKVAAMEFNLSETAFLWKHETGQSGQQIASETISENGLDDEVDNSEHYTIRFYTRDGTEVNLCGHATLAASSVIFQQMARLQGVKRNDMAVTFHAKNDVILKARPALTKTTGSSSNNASVVGVVNGSNTSSMRIAMEFPTKGVVALEKEGSGYAAALTLVKDAFFPDLNCDELEESHIVHMGVDDAGEDFLVEFTPSAFLKLPLKAKDINFKAMMEWDGYSRGIIVCCAVSDFTRRRREEESFSHPSAGAVTDQKNGDTPVVKKTNNSAVDFMSRFFGPKVGIEEDPVTGSAHCTLGPYFSKKIGKDIVIGSQKSQRGGIVECELKSNTEYIGSTGEVEKTLTIKGTTVTTMSGTLYI